MIKQIVKDVFFLKNKSQAAIKEDIHIVTDLLDTLKANSEKCVGMAANMIGYQKRIIAFNFGIGYMVMFNPEIVSQINPYTAQEGCLSLEGVRTAKRFNDITVSYQDKDFKQHTSAFSGFTAQIIQHEIDHCNGIII